MNSFVFDSGLESVDKDSMQRWITQKTSAIKIVARQQAQYQLSYEELLARLLSFQDESLEAVSMDPDSIVQSLQWLILICRSSRNSFSLQLTAPQDIPLDDEININYLTCIVYRAGSFFDKIASRGMTELSSESISDIRELFIVYFEEATQILSNSSLSSSNDTMKKITDLSTELCISQSADSVGLSTVICKSLKNLLLTSLLGPNKDLQADVIYCFIKIWTKAEEMSSFGQIIELGKRKRTSSCTSLRDLCISIFSETLDHCQPIAVHICEVLSTGLDERLKWKNQESLILCLGVLLKHASSQWAEFTSLLIFPHLYSAADHKSVAVRKVFYSVVLNSANFILSHPEQLVSESFIPSILSCIEQGVYDKNATVRFKIHSHLAQLLPKVAFQEMQNEANILHFQCLWNCMLTGLLDDSKSVRSKALFLVKSVTLLYKEQPSPNSVTFSVAHSTYPALSSSLITKLSALVRARPDSALFSESSARTAEEIVCILIGFKVFQEQFLEYALESKTPSVFALLKVSLKALQGEHLLERMVHSLSNYAPLEVEQRLEALVRMLPDLHLELSSDPEENDDSLLSACILELVRFCDGFNEQNNLILEEQVRRLLICSRILKKSIKSQKLTINKEKILSLLLRFILLLLNVESENWMKDLICHWFMQSIILVLEQYKSKNSLFVEKYCHLILQEFSEKASTIPLILKADFIQIICISPATSVQLSASCNLICLENHEAGQCLVMLFEQARKLHAFVPEVTHEDSTVLQWILQLASSLTSPLFIQVCCHDLLVELASASPEFLKSICEMLVLNLQRDPTDMKNDVLFRLTLGTCHKIIQKVSNHTACFSELIAPLCNFCLSQNQRLKTMAFVVLGKLCLLSAFCAEFFQKSIILQTFIQGLLSSDSQVEETVLHILEKIFEIDHKRIPRIYCKLFTSVSSKESKDLSQEILIVWQSFQSSVNTKIQREGNPSRDLISLYFALNDDHSKKEAILKMLSQIEPTPNALLVLKNHWDACSNEIPNPKNESHGLWRKFCLNYGHLLAPKETKHQSKASDLGSRVQTEVLEILDSAASIPKKEATKRKQITKKSAPSLKAETLKIYAESIEAFHVS